MPTAVANILLMLLVALSLPISGCSNAGDSGVRFNSNTGKHAPDWLPLSHSKTAAASRATNAGNADKMNCTSCHGEDLSGGISGVSCTSCHLGGPLQVHPAAWAPVYRDHKAYAVENGSEACSNQYCHGTSLEGVPNSGPSCTSCHLGDAAHVHPATWNPVYKDHELYVKANGTAACENRYCHGPALNGIQDSGPSCTNCHLGDASHIHPASWNPVSKDHGLYAKSNGTAACENQSCHGPDLAGVQDSGPSCTSCHLGDALHVHPPAWPDVPRDHGPYVGANGTSSCANQLCHGTDLDGVQDSGPSCTTCHLGGTTHIHPETWTDVSLNHGTFAAANGTTSCSNRSCHGATLAGESGSGPSCTSCHMGGPTTPHPPDWKNIFKNHGPAVNTYGSGNCSNIACHGASLEGVQNSGPSCTTCHGIPFSRDSLVCSACHQAPPDGTASPNRAGKHANHLALGGPVDCDTCHAGAGGNTDNDYHLYGVPVVSFSSFVSSSTGSAEFHEDTKTCSNISCHGGPRTQTPEQAELEWNGAPSSSTSSTASTPGWYSGPFDVNTQCTACHVFGTVEYNSYGIYGVGQHYFHVWYKGLSCTACHDAARVSANHFATLNTLTLEGPASATLRDELNYQLSAKTCTPACHMTAPTKKSW